MLAILKTGHFATCELRYGDAGDAAVCRCKLKGYRWAIFMAVVLFLTEIIGGVLSQSLALIGDAWHVMSDIFVYGASAYALTLKLRESSSKVIHEIDREWGKINANILMVVAGINIILAIGRFFSGHDHVLTGLMFWVATVGLIGNGLMLALLIGLGLDHEHDDHDHADEHSEHKHSAWFAKLGGWIHGSAIVHTGTDMLISVVVVSTAYLMTDEWLKSILGVSDWSYGEIDSVATIIISSILMWMAFRIKKEISHDHHH